MGVKIFQLEIPVILLMVVLYEFQAIGKVHCNGLVLLFLHIMAVNIFLSPAGILTAVNMRRHIPLNPALPAIPFLSPYKLKGIIFCLVVASPLFPVMPVIRGQMCINTVVLKDFRHGIIIGLQGSPAPVKEIVPPGMYFPSGRHTGKASAMAIGKASTMQPGAIDVAALPPVQPEDPDQLSPKAAAAVTANIN